MKNGDGALLEGMSESALDQPGAIGITKFVLRQWEAGCSGTRVVGMTPEELVALVNNAVENGAKLVDGYAPFCKHVFIENSSETRCGYMEITPEHASMIRVGYAARREGELPVLQRWLEGVEAPKARFLDVILYNRASLEEEADATPNMERDVPDADWGIVSINAELHATETPMAPITMMRNALGKEEGGSGHPLDRAAYLRSVEFWEKHASVK
jgi:hypothetical protein